MLQLLLMLSQQLVSSLRGLETSKALRIGKTSARESQST